MKNLRYSNQYNRYICQDSGQLQTTKRRPAQNENHTRNFIDYSYELTIRIIYLTTTKILWNITISTSGSKYICAQTPKIFTTIRKLSRTYSLQEKVKYGYICMQIEKKTCMAYHNLVFLPKTYLALSWHHMGTLNSYLSLVFGNIYINQSNLRLL